jgi:hypothetical protein
MQMVAMCDMGMMSALFMRSFFVMSGRLFVMAGRVLVMFSGLLMMFRSFVLGHFAFSICSHCNLIIQKGNVLERHRVNRVKVNTDRPGCALAGFGMTPQRYGIWSGVPKTSDMPGPSLAQVGTFQYRFGVVFKILDFLAIFKP